MIVLGLYPGILLDRIEPSTEAVLDLIEAVTDYDGSEPREGWRSPPGGPMITPRDQLAGILPELILGLGAALVLLIDVQWKPRPQVLGLLTAGVLLAAAGVTVVQWLEAANLLETGAGADLLVFSDMIVMDGLAIFGRLVLDWCDRHRPGGRMAVGQPI